MLLLKSEDRLNNISLSNLQTIIINTPVECADANLITYYFNGFSIDVKKSSDDIEDYYKFLKSINERYEIITEEEFNEEFRKFFKEEI